MGDNQSVSALGDEFLSYRCESLPHHKDGFTIWRDHGFQWNPLAASNLELPTLQFMK